MNRMFVWLAVIVVFLAAPLSAHAAVNWAQGVVADLTAEMVPQQVVFRLNQQMPSTCSGGYFYFGSSSPDAVKAVYAILLASNITGKNVSVEWDSSNPCAAIAVHGMF